MIQVPMSKKSRRSPRLRALAMSPPMIAPRDADEHRDDDAAWVVSGQDRFRDGAGGAAEDDPSDDSHWVLPSWHSPSQRKTGVN